LSLALFLGLGMIKSVHRSTSKKVSLKRKRQIRNGVFWQSFCQPLRPSKKIKLALKKCGH